MRSSGLRRLIDEREGHGLPARLEEASSGPWEPFHVLVVFTVREDAVKSYELFRERLHEQARLAHEFVDLIPQDEGGLEAFQEVHELSEEQHILSPRVSILIGGAPRELLAELATLGETDRVPRMFRDDAPRSFAQSRGLGDDPDIIHLTDQFGRVCRDPREVGNDDDRSRQRGVLTFAAAQRFSQVAKQPAKPGRFVIGFFQGSPG